MQSVTIYKRGVNYSFTYLNDQGQHMGEVISFPAELNESLRAIEDYIDEVVDSNKKILNYFIDNGYIPGIGIYASGMSFDLKNQDKFAYQSWNWYRTEAFIQSIWKDKFAIGGAGFNAAFTAGARFTAACISSADADKSD